MKPNLITLFFLYIGEITEVKFSIFSEPAKVSLPSILFNKFASILINLSRVIQRSALLKDIFCSWNWDLLSKHIDGIKHNYILAHANQVIRAKGFKVIECLEKDLSQLYSIELKYLSKFFKNPSTLSKGNKSQFNQSKYLEKLVNQTPIGVFQKSELGNESLNVDTFCHFSCQVVFHFMTGESMRLYYYLSPMDLIQHHQKSKDKASEGFDVTYKILSSLTTDEMIQHELGSYLTVSLLSTPETGGADGVDKSQENFWLPDCSLLMLNESDDERKLNEAFSPYLNNNFKFEK